MSASAFIATHDRIIALSDGLLVNLETLEKAGENSRKVYKISEQTLVTASGNTIKDRLGREIPEMVQDRAKKGGITDPEGIAELVKPLAINSPSEAVRLNYTVMGFDDSGNMRRFHFTHNDRSGSEKPIGPGNIGVMAHECDELAKEMFTKLVNEKARKMPLLKAAKKAWTETIRHYESDYLFGGEIFMETVSKRR